MTPHRRPSIGFSCALVATLCILHGARADARPADPRGFATALATKLRHKPGIRLRPLTHATDFGDDAIGCITFTRRELRRFGYAGHAFACEEGTTNEVLGAVLSRAGVVRCRIFGDATADGCFDLTICGEALTVCVE